MAKSDACLRQDRKDAESGRQMVCGTCGHKKPAFEFPFNRTKPTRRNQPCKECKSLHNRKTARRTPKSTTGNSSNAVSGKVCGRCGSLPHRVREPVKCKLCGLKYEAEQPVMLSPWQRREDPNNVY